MDVGVGGGDGHRCNSSVGDATLGQRHGATALVGRAAIGGGWCDDVCGGDILGCLSLSAGDGALTVPLLSLPVGRVLTHAVEGRWSYDLSK